MYGRKQKPEQQKTIQNGSFSPGLYLYFVSPILIGSCLSNQKPLLKSYPVAKAGYTLCCHTKCTYLWIRWRKSKLSCSWRVLIGQSWFIHSILGNRFTIFGSMMKFSEKFPRFCLYITRKTYCIVFSGIVFDGKMESKPIDRDAVLNSLVLNNSTTDGQPRKRKRLDNLSVEERALRR